MLGAAIVRRELGAVLRRPLTHYLQGLFVLLLGAIVIGAWVTRQGASGAMRYAELSALGRSLFELLFAGELILVSFAAPLLTGGVIAEERRLRTLDLLLLTAVGDAQIVLGKFLSRTLYLVLLILLAAPVLLACLSFGGVSTEDVLVGSALVAVSAAWSGAVGLFFSAWSRQGYQAVVRAYVLLLVQVGLTPLFLLLREAAGRRPVPLAFVTSPQAYGIGRILMQGRVDFGSRDVWPIVAGVTLAATLVLIAVAIPFVRRVGTARSSAARDDATTWRTRGAGRLGGSRQPGSRLRWWETWFLRLLVGVTAVAMAVTAPQALARTHGVAAIPLLGMLAVLVRLAWRRWRGRGPRPPVWDNPVAWKEVVFHRTRTVDIGMTLGVLVLAAVLYLGLVVFRSGWGDVRFHAYYVMLEAGVTLFLAALLAIVAFARDAESGHLELLLGTPLSAATIVLGKLAGVAVTIAPMAGFTVFHVLAATLAVGAGLDQVVQTVGLFLAVGVFHVAAALLLGLWARRVGVAMGVYLVGVLLAYGLAPELCRLLWRPQSLWPAALVAGLDPLESICAMLDVSSVYRPGLFELSFLFHLGTGMVLLLLTGFGFARLVRGRRAA